MLHVSSNLLLVRSKLGHHTYDCCEGYMKKIRMISMQQFTINQRTVTSKIRKTAAVALFILGLSVLVRAVPDDPAGTSQIDLGTLASLASNIGSNPQLISMIGSLLNPPSRPAGGSSTQTDLIVPDHESYPAASEPSSGSISEPLKRLTPDEAKKSEVVQSPSTNSNNPKTANSLSGLMSLLPNFLPRLDTSLSTGSRSTQSNTPVQTQVASSMPISRASRDSGLPETSSVSSSNVPEPGNSAQAVINQVLSAYASGQIPSELIQLSLSGRIPASIVDLALSGQVPPQIIQMVITGKIPMSTINTFLDTVQPPSTGSRIAPLGSTQLPINSGIGLLSTTRSIFEALFSNPFKFGKEKSGLTVPTLLGPIPLQFPLLPSVRKFGQLVGGTISNVSSLVPF